MYEYFLEILLLKLLKRNYQTFDCDYKCEYKYIFNGIKIGSLTQIMT